MDFVLIDLAKPDQANDALTVEFLNMTHYKSDKISQKKRPTIFMRGDNRISKIDASDINQDSSKFATTIRKESKLTPIHSVRDLADSIERYNKSLNDTTIVYCRGEAEDDL